MTIYSVRFCDKEFIAHNLRDYAKIAVFAKWYLRTQALADGMLCSVRQIEAPIQRIILPEPPQTTFPSANKRRSKGFKTSSIRKALRAFFYGVLSRA